MIGLKRLLLIAVPAGGTPSPTAGQDLQVGAVDTTVGAVEATVDVAGAGRPGVERMASDSTAVELASLCY